MLRSTSAALVFACLIQQAAGAVFTELADVPIEADARGSGVCSASLTGSIVPGDADKLRAYVEKMAPYFDVGSDATEHYNMNDGDGLTLCISGPGGSYAEALKIIEVLSTGYVKTVVPASSQCLSACAVAFMGGFYADEASRVPARQLLSGADLGFHAPSITLNGSGAMPPQMVEAAYKTALADIQGVLDTLLLNVEYSQDARMRPSLFAAMLGTPPDEMFHVTTIDELGRWRIQFEEEGDDSINLSESNLVQVCKNLFSWRHDRPSVSTADYSSKGDFPKVRIEQIQNTNPYNDNVLWRHTLMDGMFETECIFHIPPGLQRITDSSIQVEVYSEDDMIRDSIWPPTWQYLNPGMTLIDAAARGSAK